MIQQFLKPMYSKGDFDIHQKITFKNEDFHELKKNKAKLLCKACLHTITTYENIKIIDGKILHIFINPSGIMYEIGCFKEAIGAITTGDFTNDFSWFPAYDWKYTLCGNCMQHLGWFYASEGNTFYGLIIDRLVEKV